MSANKHRIFEDSDEYVTVAISIDEKAFDRLDKKQIEHLVNEVKHKGLNKARYYLSSEILRTVGKNTLRS